MKARQLQSTARHPAGYHTSPGTESSGAAIHQAPVIEPFPFEGKVRAKKAAMFLGIGISTLWLYANQGRIRQPMKFGKRVSVWDAQYIRELAEHGIPSLEEVGTE